MMSEYRIAGQRSELWMASGRKSFPWVIYRFEEKATQRIYNQLRLDRYLGNDQGGERQVTYPTRDN